MGTYEELTEEQKGKALKKAADLLLEAIISEGLRFNDEANGDDLQARIDAAMEKAEGMRTPWFAHEYIMDTCREEIEGMARADAEDATYTEPGEKTIIHGIAGR